MNNHKTRRLSSGLKSETIRPLSQDNRLKKKTTIPVKESKTMVKSKSTINFPKKLSFQIQMPLVRLNKALNADLPKIMQPKQFNSSKQKKLVL